MRDEDAIGKGLFGDILVPSNCDNDAESDEENIKHGVHYIYGELLYSVS